MEENTESKLLDDFKQYKATLFDEATKAHDILTTARKHLLDFHRSYNNCIDELKKVKTNHITELDSGFEAFRKELLDLANRLNIKILENVTTIIDAKLDESINSLRITMNSLIDDSKRAIQSIYDLSDSCIESINDCIDSATDSIENRFKAIEVHLNLIESNICGNLERNLHKIEVSIPKIVDDYIINLFSNNTGKVIGLLLNISVNKLLVSLKLKKKDNTKLIELK